MESEKTAPDFVVGLGAGFSIFAVELYLFVLFLVGEATAPANTMVLLTVLVSLLGFVQSVFVGSRQSSGFLVGFFIGGIFALYIAGHLSDPMFMPVIFGSIATIVGTFVGLFFRQPEQ